MLTRDSFIKDMIHSAMHRIAKVIVDAARLPTTDAARVAALLVERIIADFDPDAVLRHVGSRYLSADEANAFVRYAVEVEATPVDNGPVSPPVLLQHLLRKSERQVAITREGVPAIVLSERGQQARKRLRMSQPSIRKLTWEADQSTVTPRRNRPPSQRRRYRREW
jgi:hypothetical protein